eukprot:760093-Hanusia_phi.AAC.4
MAGRSKDPHPTAQAYAADNSQSIASGGGGAAVMFVMSPHAIDAEENIKVHLEPPHPKPPSIWKNRFRLVPALRLLALTTLAAARIAASPGTTFPRRSPPCKNYRKA